MRFAINGLKKDTTYVIAVDAEIETTLSFGAPVGVEIEIDRNWMPPFQARRSGENRKLVVFGQIMLRAGGGASWAIIS